MESFTGAVVTTRATDYLQVAMKRLPISILLFLLATSAGADFRETPEGVVRGFLYARLQYLETGEYTNVEIAKTCVNWPYVCERDTVWCGEWLYMSEQAREDFKHIWLSGRFFMLETGNLWPDSRDFDVMIEPNEPDSPVLLATVLWGDRAEDETSLFKVRFEVAPVGDVYLVRDIRWDSRTVNQG
jgi:hypothetical protein